MDPYIWMSIALSEFYNIYIYPIENENVGMYIYQK